MDFSLVLAGLLMGLAGAVHCTAMCGAACTAIVQRHGGATPTAALLSFHFGRLASYTAGGALAAASVHAVGAWSQALPALRPLWTLVHVAALMLGLWLVWSGRQPVWLAASRRAPALAGGGGAWHPMQGPLRAAAFGGAWVAVPCGLLQSALLVAALANGALAGALVMAAFALASSLGLLLIGTAWQRAVARPDTLRWAVRLAGAMMAAASGWALGHGLWRQFMAYCFG